MRISLWILARWLQKYDPEAHITQGDRVLRSARLSSDELRFSRSTVYLDQIQSDRILCSSGQDYLILRGDDVNAVFNDILDALEFYDDWEAGAQDRIDAGCTAAELLEWGRALLPDRALILADAGFYMREVVGDDILAERFPASREALRERLLPHEVLLEISGLRHIRAPEKPSYLIRPAGIRPGAAVTNLFDGPVHAGWLITVDPADRYSRAGLDLQDILAEAMTGWLGRSARQQEHLDRSAVFRELLDQPETAAKAEERLQLFGWYSRDPKQLYALRTVRPELDPMRALDRYLEQLNPYAFPLRYENTALWIVNHQLTPPEQYAGALAEVLARCGSVAGQSREFTRLPDLREHCLQAQIAAGFAPARPGSVLGFDGAALPYLSSVLREHCAADPRHPALAALRAYDAAHGAALAETLEVLLRHRCSYADTAAALFIHRSTLLYRLRRIQELTGVDLEDPDTRLHLQISFLMDRE